MGTDVKIHLDNKMKTDIRVHSTKGIFAVVDIFENHNDTVQLFISDIGVINKLVNTLNETKERMLVAIQENELETNSKE